MAYYSAFQRSGFQLNAFQILRAASPIEETAGDSARATPYQLYRIKEYEREKLEEKRAELKRIEDEINDAEVLRQEKLAEENKRRRAKKKAIEQAKIVAELEAEISRLRMERAWLMRAIDDEETILVLLLSMPFN